MFEKMLIFYLEHRYIDRNRIEVSSYVKGDTNVEVSYTYREGVFSKTKQSSDTIDLWDMLEFVFFSPYNF